MTLDDLCLKLAQKRKELDLTIEEVVEKTKLYPSVIRDIEAGNLGNINPAYRKGFLRIYASFLGIDVLDTLEKDSIVAPYKEKTVSVVKKEIKPKKPPALKPLSPKVKKIIIFSLVGILILWGLAGFIRFIGKRIEHLPKKAAKKVEKNTPVVFVPPAKSKEISVSLTAKRNCYLRVKVDGKLLFEAPLRKGEIESWKGNREIELKISDGSAVYLEVNSKPIPALTTSRKAIKSLKITASGISVVK